MLITVTKTNTLTIITTIQITIRIAIKRKELKFLSKWIPFLKIHPKKNSKKKDWLS